MEARKGAEVGKWGYGETGEIGIIPASSYLPVSGLRPPDFTYPRVEPQR